jgi:hypothetical protein
MVPDFLRELESFAAGTVYQQQTNVPIFLILKLVTWFISCLITSFALQETIHPGLTQVLHSQGVNFYDCMGMYGRDTGTYH